MEACLEILRIAATTTVAAIEPFGADGEPTRRWEENMTLRICRLLANRGLYVLLSRQMRKF
jgi:hypothetical protein